MQGTYSLILSTSFENKVKKFSKRLSKQTRENVINTITSLSENPFSSCLSTHKVNTRKFGLVNSSRVSKDIRILWKLESAQQNTVILLDIGGHSGGNGVYN